MGEVKFLTAGEVDKVASRTGPTASTGRGRTGAGAGRPFQRSETERHDSSASATFRSDIISPTSFVLAVGRMCYSSPSGASVRSDVSCLLQHALIRTSEQGH